MRRGDAIFGLHATLLDRCSIFLSIHDAITRDFGWKYVNFKRIVDVMTDSSRPFRVVTCVSWRGYQVQKVSRRNWFTYALTLAKAGCEGFFGH